MAVVGRFVLGPQGILGFSGGFFPKTLLARLFLRFAHIVHLPKSEHEHQTKDTQFQPNSHEVSPDSAIDVGILAVFLFGRRGS
jgi:hypothetical protein